MQPPPRTGDRGNWLAVKLRRETEGAGRLDGLLASGDSGGSLWMQTPAGWAVVGVNANGGDQYDDYSFFARVSGLRPWLTSNVPGCGSGGEGWRWAFQPPDLPYSDPIEQADVENFVFSRGNINSPNASGRKARAGNAAVQSAINITKNRRSPAGTANPLLDRPTAFRTEPADARVITQQR